MTSAPARPLVVPFFMFFGGATETVIASSPPISTPLPTLIKVGDCVDIHVDGSDDRLRRAAEEALKKGTTSGLAAAPASVTELPACRPSAGRLREPARPGRIPRP